MDTKTAVNNSVNPKKTIIPFSYMASIDRIQFSIKNPDTNYSRVRDLLTAQFGKPTVTRPDGKLGKVVNGFKWDGKMIQLVNYPRPEAHWFSVSIHDPETVLQNLCRDMFYSLFKGETPNSVSVTEIEVAWDFIPDDSSLLWLVRDTISNTLYLKYSRENSCNHCESTIYQGIKGNVHLGSRGSRFYGKLISDEPVFRVELQLNRKLIKKLKLGLMTIPIGPSKFDFFDYFEFRKGYSAEGLGHLIEQWSRIIGKKQSSKKPPIDHYSTRQRVMRQIWKRSCFGEKQKNVFDDNISVAKQITGYKNFKSRHNITHQIGYFFPVEDILRFRSPKYNRGSLRVPSWITT